MSLNKRVRAVLLLGVSTAWLSACGKEDSASQPSVAATSQPVDERADGAKLLVKRQALLERALDLPLPPCPKQMLDGASRAVCDQVAAARAHFREVQRVPNQSEAALQQAALEYADAAQTAREIFQGYVMAFLLGRAPGLGQPTDKPASKEAGVAGATATLRPESSEDEDATERPGTENPWVPLANAYDREALRALTQLSTALTYGALPERRAALGHLRALLEKHPRADNVREQLQGVAVGESDRAFRAEIRDVLSANPTKVPVRGEGGAPSAAAHAASRLDADAVDAGAKSPLPASP